MRAGAVWWGQIGSSLRFRDRVVSALRDCRPVVLRLPRRLPWREEFYRGVDEGRAAFSGDRRLKRLAWRPGEDPGQFVLEELCSDQVRADYWPGESVAAYLASLEDILLNDYYVWITGLHHKADLFKWGAFVGEYERRGRDLPRRALFLLEYDGPAGETGGLEQLAYAPEDYDCRVFCLEAAAALDNAGLLAYQAELALCMGGGDPEFSFALLEAGEELLQDPVAVAERTAAGGRDSSGAPFPPVDPQQAASAAWEAAVVLLFPALERRRMAVIQRNEAELGRYLPITNSNGDRITEPCDLDIGPLWYVLSAGRVFPPEDVEAMRLCRRVRNQLAHNRPVPYEEVKKVLAL